jgi:hypothetical protein
MRGKEGQSITTVSLFTPVVAQEVEIEQPQDAGFQLQTRLRIVELEDVDRQFGLQAGEL